MKKLLFCLLALPLASGCIQEKVTQAWETSTPETVRQGIQYSHDAAKAGRPELAVAPLDAIRTKIGEPETPLDLPPAPPPDEPESEEAIEESEVIAVAAKEGKVPIGWGVAILLLLTQVPKIAAKLKGAV